MWRAGQLPLVGTFRRAECELALPVVCRQIPPAEATNPSGCLNRLSAERTGFRFFRVRFGLSLFPCFDQRKQSPWSRSYLAGLIPHAVLALNVRIAGDGRWTFLTPDYLFWVGHGVKRLVF